MNPWNKTHLTSSFDEKMKKMILEYYTEVISYTGQPRTRYTHENKLSNDCINYLKSKYEEGFGIKVIARDLGLSYSRMRSLFSYCDIELRTGYDVCTEITRKFRSDRVLAEKNPWFNWAELKPEMIKTNKRGIQGYYKKKDGELVWLRSSYEYTIAKWLDANDIKFKVEHARYLLSSGKYYLPDFFIFNNEGVLLYLIETKGFYKNGLTKVELFKDEYDIDIIVIEDVKQFLVHSHKGELVEWRSICGQKLKK